jgi:tRNA (cmo5U34)-methyltransferase
MLKAGKEIQVNDSAWTFEGDVCNQFDEHVKMSVPLYSEGHEFIIGLSRFYLKDNSVCYDIGSSTGTLLNKLSAYTKKKIKYIGIETSHPMYKYSIENNLKNDISYLNSDVLDVSFEKSDFIISYYTLQFIHKDDRLKVVSKIYESLREGSAFVLFEKVRARNSYFQDILSELYIDFKQKSGFSNEEIFGKQRSLIGVMDPNTTQENVKMLKQAGFSKVTRVSKYLAFEGYLAIK